MGSDFYLFFILYRSIIHFLIISRPDLAAVSPPASASSPSAEAFAPILLSSISSFSVVICQAMGSLIKLNGPQRTACLAKGCTND